MNNYKKSILSHFLSDEDVENERQTRLKKYRQVTASEVVVAGDLCGRADSELSDTSINNREGWNRAEDSVGLTAGYAWDTSELIFVRRA